MEFPLYAVRGYTSLGMEGKFLVIQGHKTKYILDEPGMQEQYPLYEDRRMLLLKRAAPYRLYPLTQRIESLEALIDSGKTMFIDRYGKLVKWSKKSFSKVITCKIVTTVQTDKGHWRVWINELEHPFYVVSYNGQPYLQFVRINNVPTLYALLEEKRKDTRIKI